MSSKLACVTYSVSETDKQTLSSNSSLAVAACLIHSGIQVTMRWKAWNALNWTHADFYTLSFPNQHNVTGVCICIPRDIWGMPGMSLCKYRMSVLKSDVGAWCAHTIYTPFHKRTWESRHFNIQWRYWYLFTMHTKGSLIHLFIHSFIFGHSPSTEMKPERWHRPVF